MTVTATISSAPPVNPGLDYAALRAEGIALIAELAGSVWTNHNESDPGVTTLEQLCYALTELSYRAELPLEDLLVEGPGRRIDPRRQALYPARRIFPCNPVTEEDYRRLLLDRLEELGNVWLEPNRAAAGGSVGGLYDVFVYAPSLPAPPCADSEGESRLRERIRRVYGRHRNLCEDLRAIHVLRPRRATVKADVSIGDAPRAETILAHIFFRLGMLFAPEPRRESLAEAVRRGQAPSAIFNGPLMMNGFISGGELQPKADSISMTEVVRAVARTPGVLSARDVEVCAGNRSHSGDDVIPVPKRELLQLDPKSAIRLWRHGVEISPDPARVRRELERLWMNQRRRYRLSAQYDQFFPFPSGTWRDVEQYESVQNQFPDAYGINEYGVAGGAPVTRHAQAKQFKGYLMVFDQLLADFFAQLAHAKDLYSIDPRVDRTYFFQSLERSVPNVEPLLMPDYRAGLARIVEGEDAFAVRRNRFLDFLLALYAEHLDSSTVWTLQPDGEQSPATATTLLQAKLALLRRMVAVTHNRGRAVDYLERPSRGNMAGMEMKIRIQLGMDVLDVRPLFEVAGELGVQLVERESEGSAGRTLPRHAELIEEQFAHVPLNGSAVPAPLRAAIPDALSASAGEIEQMRVGRLPGDNAWSVVWRFSGAPEWRLAGKYPDRESACAAAESFAALLGQLRRHSQQLYIVEHNLLRFGRFRDTRRRGDARFPYSFTATAVLSPPPRLRRDDDYRDFARRVIRANAPTHVAMHELFLGPAQMFVFEPLYWAWRHALRSGGYLEKAVTSFALRVFLQLHGKKA
jgi:hypothetical protein